MPALPLQLSSSVFCSAPPLGWPSLGINTLLAAQMGCARLAHLLAHSMRPDDRSGLHWSAGRFRPLVAASARAGRQQWVGCKSPVCSGTRARLGPAIGAGFGVGRGGWGPSASIGWSSRPIGARSIKGPGSSLGRPQHDSRRQPGQAGRRSVGAIGGRALCNWTGAVGGGGGGGGWGGRLRRPSMLPAARAKGKQSAARNHEFQIKTSKKDGARVWKWRSRELAALVASGARSGCGSRGCRGG